MILRNFHQTNLQELSRNLDEIRSTPLGNIQEERTQWKLAELIATLNQSHPHYDYTHASPQQFHEIENLREVIERINTRLDMLPDNDPPIRIIFWNAIEETVQCKNCECYCFIEESLRPGVRWEEHIFLVNRESKLLVYIFLEGNSKLHSHSRGSNPPELHARFPSSPSLPPQSNNHSFGMQPENHFMEEIDGLMPPSATVKIEPKY